MTERSVSPSNMEATVKAKAGLGSTASSRTPTHNAERLASEAIKFWGIDAAAEACRQWATGATTPLSRHEWLAAAGIVEDAKTRHESLDGKST